MTVLKKGKGEAEDRRELKRGEGVLLDPLTQSFLSALYLCHYKAVPSGYSSSTSELKCPELHSSFLPI